MTSTLAIPTFVSVSLSDSEECLRPVSGTFANRAFDLAAAGARPQFRIHRDLDPGHER